MLLKREQKNDIIKGIYKSSNILVSEYNKKNNDLTIIFKGGGKYTYKDVLLKDFTRFEMADSQGVVFNSHIKNNYSWDKLDKIDTATITEDIKKIFEDDIKSTGLTLISKMEQLIEGDKVNGVISKKLLSELKQTITIYETKRDTKH